MKRLATICALAGLVLSVVPAARGDPFVNPPGDNPNISWQTSFPYQRNIMLDFSVNPVGAVGPIPGADYEGYDDPHLWCSDFVTMTDDVEWNAALGAVGIFNAPENASGTLTIHIHNWVRDWPVKHLYEEMVLVAADNLGGGSSLSQIIVRPSGVMRTGYWHDLIGTNPAEVLTWYELEPNPPWEEKVFTFTVLGGGSMYLDSVHIATECVPVPGAVLLGIIGLGVAGAKLRKHA